jgi:hypothetical protein
MMDSSWKVMVKGWGGEEEEEEGAEEGRDENIFVVVGKVSSSG